MATATTEQHTHLQLLETLPQCPILEQRFSVLKQSIIKPEHKEKVIASYGRLCQILKDEVARIEKIGSNIVPQIDFAVVHENNGELPEGFADLVRDRGCCILRNVVPQEQAEKWEAELKEYTKKHPGVGGFPVHNPQNWSLFWTKPQVELRSHPQVLEAMAAVSKLWHVSDPTLPVDLTSQVAYPDRFRIRYPTKEQEYTLNSHLDSGGIERWEDAEYRSCYQAIFEGRWEEYDAWDATPRPNAKTDLYGNASACSCWRSLQGWLSLSHTGTGEGTLRLLPNMKAVIAYIMLRPFFVNGAFDDVTATFPGSDPGWLQFYPTAEFHPDLDLKRSVVGIPPVKPGDYVFWHADVVHEVDKLNPGKTDSSVAYNPCTPLIPYNLESLVNTKAAFLATEVPKDFLGVKNDEKETEKDHEDHGARIENILSEEGRRAMGFAKFDVEEEGITEGQRKIRQLANERLGLA